jgi:hypothetical protein
MHIELTQDQIRQCWKEIARRGGQAVRGAKKVEKANAARKAKREKAAASK